MVEKLNSMFEAVGLSHSITEKGWGGRRREKRELKLSK